MVSQPIEFNMYLLIKHIIHNTIYFSNAEEYNDISYDEDNIIPANEIENQPQFIHIDGQRTRDRIIETYFS